MDTKIELLKSLDILLEDLTPEQKEGLRKIGETINPSSLTAPQAMKIVNDLGLDLKKLQKKARRIRAEKLKLEMKPKIGENEKCSCGSGKKYKKCCKNKSN